MFRNAKVGDKVFDYVLQEWAEIISISKKKIYPISIKYEDGEDSKFAINGNHYIYDKVPRYFWDEVKPIIPPKKPISNLEVDTKVIVWNLEDDKQRRYFSHFDSDGRIYAFLDGRTFWNSAGAMSWKYWELAEEE